MLVIAYEPSSTAAQPTPVRLPFLMVIYLAKINALPEGAVLWTQEIAERQIRRKRYVRLGVVLIGIALIVHIIVNALLEYGKGSQ